MAPAAPSAVPPTWSALAMDGWFSPVLRVLSPLCGVLVLVGFVYLAVPEAQAATPSRDDEVTDPYLKRLLDEINLRRKVVGSSTLAFVPRPANDALGKFFGETAPAISWPRPCDHQLLDGAYSWDYMQSVSGFGAQAHGEVLACPGPEAFWTPERAA